jgi:peptide/nickel transport system permease protein
MATRFSERPPTRQPRTHGFFRLTAGRQVAMHAYVLRRLLALLPTLFIASVIVFVIVRMVPGDVVDLMLSQNDAGSNQLTRDQLLQTLGMDKPMWQQYGIWIGQLALHGNLGNSLWQGDSVVSMIATRLPVTFELGLLAMVIALSVAIPVGVYSAVKQDAAGDYVARSFSLLMLAMPSFWIGTMVTVFPSIWWGWSPEIHYMPFREDPVQNLRQMIIPAVMLGLALSAITMRMTRTMMLEVLRQDYIRTARAKGLKESLILTRHAIRNGLIPVITLIGAQAPLLIGGAVILEQIFVLPGMGMLLLDAVNQRDYPVVTGVFFVVGLTVMLINLLVDLSYGLIDPKVRQR